MNLLKSVNYYVSGSNKEFHIYECTVEEVLESRDSKDRKQIEIVVEGKTYRGLYNKSVYENLCANEGTPSFIVLWPTGKGNYMLAYKWDIWKDHIDGNEPETLEPEPEQVKDAFVYLWTHATTKRMYIGTHKGTPDDGYVASGDLFMNDYLAEPHNFSRNILAYGTQEEMLHLETVLLLHLKARTNDMYYNISDNLRK